MTTEELIVRLAGSAGPVRLLRPPGRRLFLWGAPSIALTGLGVALIGARVDLSTAIGGLPFLVLAFVAVATSFVAAGAALRLSVPGTGRSPDLWVPIAAAGGWALVLVASLASSGPVERVFALSHLHVGCVLQIAALALFPGWALLAMLRRAAPLPYRWIGGAAALAAASLAAGGTQFICPLDDPAHLLVGHFVPVIALASSGVALGRRALAQIARF